MHKFREKFRCWRKNLENHWPYVRRKRLKQTLLVQKELEKINAELHQEHEALAKILLIPGDALATTAKINCIVAIEPGETEELCLFVTYAASRELKPHVIDHVLALIEANVAVILIINTELHASEFILPPKFASRLTGLLVRENVGYDFAAWAHAFSLLSALKIRQRLYLINDSIVGPFDIEAYRIIFERIRHSSADMIGLTQNPWPIAHLQSFYLAFNESLFNSPAFHRIMSNVLNLPTKQAVINTYETQLTYYFRCHGFQCEAVFPSMTPGEVATDDTIFNWDQLIECGFPFIKASVLQRANKSGAILRLIPRKYR